MKAKTLQINRGLNN